ncbi:MAG: GH116 family glycosyl-hydrolase [Luteolibacter sp.]
MMQRRKFLQLSAASGLFYGLGARPALAGDDAAALYAKFVPKDKRLSTDWLASLTQRGHKLDAPIRYDKKDVDLGVIGMTVGGIGCGTVYLSGDGRLWVWDIFNQHHEGVVKKSAKGPEGMVNIGDSKRINERSGANFLEPPKATEHLGGVSQGFTLRDGGRELPMNGTAWKDIRFTGRWPIGRVDYADPSTPFIVRLEAFSPFIPLNLRDSSLPVTILEYTVRNTGTAPRTFTLAGQLGNALGQFSNLAKFRRSAKAAGEGFTAIHHTLGTPETKTEPQRPEHVLFDFEGQTYEGWKVEGTAFGQHPATRQTTPAYQGDTKLEGEGYVNSHVTAPGSSVDEKDGAVGRMLSPEFTIDRRFLTFLIGGGRNPETTAVRLIVDGKMVASASGEDNNAMHAEWFDVSSHEGKVARIEIVDAATGPWGNIGADQFVLTDVPQAAGDFTDKLDYGSMALACLGAEAVANPAPDELSVSAELAAGESKTFTFAITWHVPNLNPAIGMKDRKRHYASEFATALDVMAHVSKHASRLAAETRKWVETWNDSTLPQWLLDRTILTANTLQTQTSLILDDGRFWAWEGVGACAGTCGHVWEYAQGHARLFPEIERNLREKTDFAFAQKPDGGIDFRGVGAGIAIDAQCGYVLRTLRDHQLSNAPEFLKRVWPGAKKAMEYLIEFDRRDPRGGLDGLLDGSQHNTLDANWFGKVHVLCSMYLGALRAGEELARAAGDAEFSAQCRSIYEMGSKNIAKLFNGEYYVQIEDPAHPEAIGVGTGCYIDQVMGQFWANQTGLGRLYQADHQKSALRALWKYNFITDYWTFRKGFPNGRFYGTDGDYGLLMCTWPKGGLREDFKKHWQYRLLQ